jgi:hypothetical protein
MRRLWTSLLAATAALGVATGSLALAQDEAQDEPDPASASDRDCPTPQFRAQMMTPVAGRVPRDASLLVGLVPGGSLRELPATVQLRRRRRTVALRREAIAPGLYRLTPDVRRIWGRYDVEGVEGEPRVRFSRPGLPAPPSTPRLSRVERYRAVSGGESRLQLEAHFEFPIPQGVVAVVSYWGDDDAPDLWSRAVATQNRAVLYSAAGECTPLPPGASAPPSEGTVRVAFVDRFGQVSQASAPVSL